MWWLILAGYAVPMVGGMVWSGCAYAMEVAEVEQKSRDEGWYLGEEEMEIRKTKEMAVALVSGSLVWPLALIAVVLYYVIASPFLIGNYLGGREVERKVALRKKYTEQADYLQSLAKDEADTSVREILRSGADSLRQQAKTL